MVLFRNWRHGLGQHSVYAELDAHRIILGLDMNVAGPALQRREDRGVHEADDWAHVALLGQLVNRNTLVAAFFLMDHIQSETFAGVFEHALRLFRLL